MIWNLHGWHGNTKMNEFTKEELKLLFGSLGLWMEEILYEDEKEKAFRNELYRKLRSMIKQMECVHHSEELLPYGSLYTCIHCGKLFQ